MQHASDKQSYDQLRKTKKKIAKLKKRFKQIKKKNEISIGSNIHYINKFILLLIYINYYIY